ncbi:MAG TPA: hypothetical protein VLZ53_01970 [Devosia sp.]|nr:hypothetical protein [Devosia sp.]
MLISQATPVAIAQDFSSVWDKPPAAKTLVLPASARQIEAKGAVHV